MSSDNQQPESQVNKTSLESRLLETKGQLARVVAQNEKLAYTLRESREHIAHLREEVDKLSQPPHAYGVVVGKNDDASIDIFIQGRKMKVQLHPDIDFDVLERGSEVLLNDSMNVIATRRPETSGEVVQLKEICEDGFRAIITYRGDDQKICELGDSLRGMHLRPGDLLRLEPKSNLLIERLHQPEVENLLLEEVPLVSYSDIGGLDAQIELIADAVELPYLYSDLFAEYHLPAPKGILLYGPPGCGKTLIAKAVAQLDTIKVVATSSILKDPNFSTNMLAKRNVKYGSSFKGLARRAKRVGLSSSFSTRWIRCFVFEALASAATWSQRSFRNY